MQPCHVHQHDPEGQQIDAAQARGIGKYDTFVMVTADASEIQFNVYRCFNSGQFSLTDSWAIPEPATLILFAAGGVLLLRRNPKP